MIPLNEASKLEFSLSIQNSSSQLDKATLFIEGGQYDIALPIILEGDKAKVSVPVLENVLKPGTYKMRLEMVLGGVLYTPFTDNLDFNAPPTIKVESAAVVAAPVISVAPKMTIQPVVEEKIPEPVVEEAKPSNYKMQFADLLKTAFESSKNNQ